jgi:hypothetical protein
MKLLLSTFKMKNNMNQSEKYFFSDFTFEAYKNMLIDAKNHYSFIFHSDFLTRQDTGPILIWRHDLDMSLKHAVQFAEIEFELEIKSTYFIHLHSEYYHFFEHGTFNDILRIKELGHKLALHFDTHFYNIKSEDQLEQSVITEKKLMEEIFSCSIDTFSFHNTTPFILSSNKLKYGGLINAYAEIFQKEIAYCSDSYGVWRFERLPEILGQRKYKELQVLTHPELWTEKISSPHERVILHVNNRASSLHKMYEDLLKKNNRGKIDWYE